jgi:hypothetical protein
MVKDGIDRESLATEMSRGRAAALEIKLTAVESARRAEINRNGGGIKNSNTTKDENEYNSFHKEV